MDFRAVFGNARAAKRRALLLGFLFRNEERTVFGKREFWEITQVDFRQMSSRVVSDEEFRSSLISDDEDLQKIWKRH